MEEEESCDYLLTEYDRGGKNKGQSKGGLDKDGQGKDGQGKDGLGKDGQGKDGLGKDGQGKDGLGKDGLNNNGLDKDGQGKDGQGKDSQDMNGKGAYGQGAYGQGTDGQGAAGQGADGQNKSGQGKNGQGSEEQGPEVKKRSQFCQPSEESEKELVYEPPEPEELKLNINQRLVHSTTQYEDFLLKKMLNHMCEGFDESKQSYFFNKLGLPWRDISPPNLPSGKHLQDKAKRLKKKWLMNIFDQWRAKNPKDSPGVLTKKLIRAVDLSDMRQTYEELMHIEMSASCLKI